jgi:hypothetical protein
MTPAGSPLVTYRSSSSGFASTRSLEKLRARFEPLGVADNTANPIFPGRFSVSRKEAAAGTMA